MTLIGLNILKNGKIVVVTYNERKTVWAVAVKRRRNKFGGLTSGHCILQYFYSMSDRAFT